MSEIFATTHWTLVRGAADRSAAGREALSELCAAYYEPVVAFLRRSGRHDDAAREMAHGFFEHLLAASNLAGAEPARGRFRNYLLGALKHHLTHVRERDARQKRGGGIETVPLEPGADAADHTLPPDREFDRQWALHILRRATDALAAEWRAAGEAEEFAALQPFIAGESAHGGLAALATSRGQNPATLRKTVSRMRQRFRQHVKAQIAPTLLEPDDADDEMRALLAALAA